MTSLLLALVLAQTRVGPSQGQSTLLSALTDFNVVTAGAKLTIAGTCTVANPCNVRWGGRTVAVNAAGVATLLTGTGAALVYVTYTGSIVVALNGLNGLSVACTGCVMGAATQFPSDSFPLAVCQVSLGQWVSCVDMRGFFAGYRIMTGFGIVAADAVDGVSLSIDSASVPIWISVPTSATSPCSTGNLAVDTTYLYVCVAMNQWRRIQGVAW